MRPNNKNGFSLLEVMIVGGILVTLSMGGLKLMKMQSQSTTKFSFDSESTFIINEIAGLLSDPVKCMNTLGGKNAVSTTSGIDVINLTKFRSRDGGATSGYGNGNIEIKSYNLKGTNPSSSHATTLIINFINKKVLNETNVRPLVSKKIELYVDVDGSNNITNCYSLSNAPDIWSRGTGTDIFYMNDVGIGTSTPSSALHVKGGANATGFAGIYSQGVNATDAPGFCSVNNTNGLFGCVGGASAVGSFGPTDTTVGDFIVSSRTNMRFATGMPGWSITTPVATTSKMSILSNGRVGIGTTTPLSKLQVVGGIRANKGNGNTDTSQVGFSYDEDGDTGVFAIGGTPFNGSTLILKNDNTLGLSVVGGNVGIGTLTPGVKLDVNGGIKVGGLGLCDSGHEGVIRYNSGAKQMQFCDGTNWISMVPPPSKTFKVESPTIPTHTSATTSVNCPAGTVLTSCKLHVVSGDGMSMHFQERISYTYTGSLITGCSVSSFDTDDTYKLVLICVR